MSQQKRGQRQPPKRRQQAEETDLAWSLRWLSRFFWLLTILGLSCITIIVMYLSKQIAFMDFLHQYPTEIAKVVCGVALLAANAFGFEKLTKYVHADPAQRWKLAMSILTVSWILTDLAYIWLTFLEKQTNFFVFLGATIVALIFVIGLFMRLTD